MSVDEQRMRFTVERYEQMVDAGILTKDDHVELLEGEILEMTPIGTPHSRAVQRLTRLFYEHVSDRALILVQAPVRLPPDSEPQPDVALADLDALQDHHPEPDELLLVAEVVHSTHRRDRRKLAEYARKGVREAWFVDVRDQRVEVHREPTPDGYQNVEIVGRDGTVSPLAFPDVRLAVDEIFD